MVGGRFVWRQPQGRFVLQIGFFGPGLGLLKQPHSLFAGPEQLVIERFVVRRGGSLPSWFVGDSLPRRGGGHTSGPAAKTGREKSGKYIK